jgi:phosphoribosylformimino-5-aminoimidazole carboxamide ribotide isomerase
MIVIPAIDIYNNKIVRLKQGDFNQVQYYDIDILSLLKKYIDNGLKRIHIVDLMGAKIGKVSIKETISSILNHFPEVTLQFGGGIRSYSIVEELNDLGVYYFIISSLPFKDRNEFERIVDFVGADRIIIASDVFEGNIAIGGWLTKTGTSIYDFINDMQKYNINNFLCTDISKDGMLTGPNVNLYNKILETFPNINLIASGGISSIIDVNILKDNNLYGCVLGKSLLDNKIEIEELKKIVN